jgi:hypothetical protein
LGFARSPSTYAAAEPRHLYASARQAGQQIIKLRQFDLQLALASPGAAREDIQDQLSAIHNLAVESPLEVPLLGGGKIPVEDHGIDAQSLDVSGELVDLAASDQRGSLGIVAALNGFRENLGARTGGENFELLNRFFTADTGKLGGPAAAASIGSLEI